MQKKCEVQCLLTERVSCSVGLCRERDNFWHTEQERWKEIENGVDALVGHVAVVQKRKVKDGLDALVGHGLNACVNHVAGVLVQHAREELAELVGQGAVMHTHPRGHRQTKRLIIMTILFFSFGCGPMAFPYLTREMTLPDWTTQKERTSVINVRGKTIQNESVAITRTVHNSKAQSSKCECYLSDLIVNH